MFYDFGISFGIDYKGPPEVDEGEVVDWSKTTKAIEVDEDRKPHDGWLPR